MRRVKQIGVLLGMFVGLLVGGLPVRGTDIPIFPTGPVYQLKGLVWGTSTQPGFNNNYLFTPLNLNESVCVYVKNNNPTNPHTFTASIVVTPDPSNTTPSDGTWQSAASSTGLSSPISPGLPAGISGQVSGVSQVSINLSGSSTQAGNPDTANVTIVQTSGNCFAGGQMISSAPQNVSAVPPIQTISDGLSQAFVAQISATNPASGILLLNVNPNSGPKNVYFDKLVLSCSAACNVSVGTANGNGTTCTVEPGVNQKIGSSVTTTSSVLIASCGVNPALAGNNIFNGVFLAAGQSFTFDLRGFIGPSGSTQGISVIASAFTGVVTGNMTWYEK